MIKNRKPNFNFSFLCVLLLATFFIFSTGNLQGQDYAKYQTYDQMSKTLKDLVNSNKNIAKIESIGKSLEGRDLWLITIANQKGTPVNERPGLFIGANFEGDHLIGSQLSVATIDYLLKNYSSNETVKKGVDENVYYIIPRVNPDGAEQMFASVKSGQKTNTNKYDGDNDGRMDEDGPEDLNKDGFITVMRVKDPNGEYMIVPDDSRLMKKADATKGESGEYKIYWEGIDNDKDGFINEDPAGGIDLNRNFQHEYPYYKDDAGWHMVSELESRAIMDWVISHRNVSMILTFGESDNLIKAPNSRGQLSSDQGIDLFNFANASKSGADKVGMVSTMSSRFGRFGMRGFRGQQQETESSGRRQRPARKPETTVNKADQEYYTTVSKKYIEITGIKEQPVVRDPKGAFFGYGYYQYGVPSFSTPGWGIDLPADSSEQGRRGGRGRMGGSRTEGQTPPQVSPQGRTARGGATAASPQAAKPGIDKKFIKWADKENKAAFVEWKSFNHPTLGEVEIGGFSPYEVTNPPAGKIAELGVKHGEFAAYLSTLFAKIKIAKTEVVNHGGGLFRIKAEVENVGFLPTSLQHGVASRSVKPTMVQLGVKPDQIISGNSKNNFFQQLDGSGNRQKYEWIIKGKSGDKVEIKVVAQKAGTDKKVITLK